MNFFYTYVLLCTDNKKNKKTFYTGSTSNIGERNFKHLTKGVKSTKRFNKIALVYYEACLSKKDARKRELQLKTGFGRGYIKRRIKDYLSKRD